MPLRQRILDALPIEPEKGLTKQHLMESLAMSEKPLRTVLTDLEEQLEVSSEKRGRNHVAHYWRMR